VAADGDDGYIISDSTFDNSSTTAFFGLVSSLSYDFWARFSSVTIPIGATITNAFIRFTASNTRGGVTVRTNIHFVDDADPSTPTTYNDVENASLTSEVAWDNVSAWNSAGVYDTPDIASILQDVIDLGGWASGNAVIVQVREDGSNNGAYRQAATREHVSYDSVELHVTWTE